MKNFSFSSLIVTLLAAFALYVPLSGTKSFSEESAPGTSPTPADARQTPSPSPSQTPKPPAQEPQGEAARLLCEFLGATAAGKDGGESTASQGTGAKAVCLLKPKLAATKRELELDFLIATIPDPKESRLDHLFDGNLGGIQRALEAAGYVFDQYWLPWERTTTPVATASTRHLQEPGVMIFRNNGNSSKSVLALFLVGETPTYGIHKQAFQNALLQMEQLLALPGVKFKEGKPSDQVRVLGPTFSGSATSLALALKSWFEQPAAKPHRVSKAKVITGTATAIAKPEFIETAGGESRVEFFATIMSEEQAREAFIKHLVEENKPLLFGERSRILPPMDEAAPDQTHIALLSEATTGYGLQTAKKIQTQAKKIQDEAKQNALSATKEEKPSQMDKPFIMSLTFPLHISQLRIEATKNKGARNGQSNGLQLKESNLALPTDAGAQKPRDVVQPFSSMSAVTTELALTEVLLAIHRERIRYVGLSSTDVMDRLFLIKQIREQCPNTVIFCFSSDLLYLHSDANVDAQGVLIVTSYPLFPQNQLWTYPFEFGRTRLQFATQATQGVYNATLALMDKPDLLLEYGEPFRTYNAGDKRFPALWLTIVGRNGIWPIKTLPYNPQEKGYVWPAPVGDTSEKAAPRLGLVRSLLSPTGLGVLLLIGILCLIPSMVLVAQLALFKLEEAKPEESDEKNKASAIFRIKRRVSITLRYVLWRFKLGRIGQIFGDEDFYRYRFTRRTYLMACCSTLLTIALFSCGVSLLPGWMNVGVATQTDQRWQWWQYTWIIRPLSYLVLIGITACFLWLLYSICDWLIGGWRHLRRIELALIALCIALAMAALALGGLSDVYFNWNSNPASWELEKVFFFFRTTELASGVSLLMPVALIGLAGFLTFFSVVRRINLAERMACLPSPQERAEATPAFLRFEHVNAGSFNGLHATESRIREMLVGGGWNSWMAALLTGGILIVYVLLYAQSYTPSVDGRRFDYFFLAMFFLIPLLLVWTFVRFIRLWAALRRLLRRLAWHPLFANFAAAHSDEKRFQALPPTDLLSPPPTYTALTISVRQAACFLHKLTLPVEQRDELARLHQLIVEAEAHLSQAMQFEAAGNWQKGLLNRRNCEERLAALSEEVTVLLEPTWKPATGKDAVEAEAWHDEAKFFLVTHVAAFLQHVFANLQNLVALVTAGLLLILLASNSYPFQPRQPLLLFSWVTMLTVVFTTLFIFVQMSRDKVLSLLSGTTPGKLNFTRDFVLRVLIHGVIPVVALLGVQFPEILRQLFSWLSAFQGGTR
ncbi:MAG TPA: hypothetical protein PLD20_13535 [Blastocatellia bacterium]|nr:hypothetical protein [Blastocatellia bacterium]HMV83025.1 hypothetical protein [Blastocatellia bacterium]HMX26636.1 hypothetical protein [Blastocatellia bacterium]HMY72152.1 hypothetical protein [Blastocatellia bacterium]HMZ18953.1 hypothetical protein [Blastocatellia bacterium]